MRGEAEPAGMVVLVFALAFAPLNGLLRVLGHLLQHWTLAGLLLDALFYPGVLLVLLLGLGRTLSLLTAHFGGSQEPGLGLRVCLYASTPLWLCGFFHLVPWGPLQILAPFLGLLGMGHLLFLGLHHALGVHPARVVPLATLLLAPFILLFVLLTQMLPLVLFGS